MVSTAGRLEPYLLIIAGGFAGACARYAVAEALPGTGGIFLVNSIGCFLLGLLMFESIYIGAFSPQTRLAYGVGFIGSFTTFSTFSVQTLASTPQLALLNVLASLAAGLAGVFLGRTAAVALSGRRSWTR